MALDRVPLLHPFQFHRYCRDVSLSDIAVAASCLFVACNLVRDLYWRYIKRYPPMASWLWVPFLGHLPAFAIAPQLFIWNAYRMNGGRPFVFDMMSCRLVICGRGEADAVFRAKEESLEAEGAIMKLTSFDLTLGADLFQPIHKSGANANALTVRKFFTPNMDDHVRPMVEECLRVAHKWHRADPVIRDMEGFVLDMVAAAASRALFGKRLSSNPTLAREMKEFSAKVQEITVLSSVMPREKLSGRTVKVTEAKGIMSRILTPEIQERRKRLEEEKAAHEVKGEDETKEPKNFLDYLLLQTEVDGAPLTDERICNCIYAMIFGAYDTTAHAATHLLYDIAGRDDVKTEVLREQERARTRYRDEAVASGSPVDPIGHLSIDAIKNMRVLESALRESQRLSASVFGPLRMVMKEGMALRDSRMVLQKGSILTLSPWLVHRDPDIYENPNEYRLKRFEEESKGFPSMKRFLNFGGGRHLCPGRFFATLEIKCIVSALLSQFEVSSERPAPYAYDNFTIIKRKAVPVRLKCRPPEE